MPNAVTMMQDPYFICPQSWLWSEVYHKLHTAWETKQAAWLAANPITIAVSDFDLGDEEETALVSPIATAPPVIEFDMGDDAGEDDEKNTETEIATEATIPEEMPTEMGDFPGAANTLAQEAARGIPAPPLMLPAFGAQPGTLKDRWRETVEWAQEYDCINLIPELHEDDCFFQ